MWWLRLSLVSLIIGCSATGGGPGDPCGASTSTAFSISVASVAIRERQPTGQAWDIDGSYADPYVCIGSEAGTSWPYQCSASQANVTSAGFNASSQGIATDDVYVDIWDEDLVDDELIGGWAFGLAELRAYADCGPSSLQGDATSGVIDVQFEVRTL